jgi:hypothetical protein
MNGKKAAFLCVSVALFGIVCLLSRAQSPGEGPPPATPPKAVTPPSDDLFGPVEGVPKSAPRTFAPAAEKSVLTQPPKQSPKAEPPAADTCQCVVRGDSAATKRIEQVLAGPLDHQGLDYQDQPLRDIVTQLQDEYHIPIQVNKAALDEAAIGLDSKVTISLNNISLRAALNLLLKQNSLTFIIQDEVLMITTKEEAEKELVMCVYNVQGLVDDSDSKSMDSLIDAISSCVATDTWATNGGGGAEIRPLPPGLLVVSQTAAVHEEVKGLLAKIRTMREQVPIVKGRTRASEPAPSQSHSKSSEQSEKAKRPAAAASDENPFGR